MAEVLLINPDYIKRNTHLNGSVEEGYMNPFITLAQDKYLQIYLGTKLFDKIKADVAAGTISGVYKTLLDSYCLKVVLWWYMVEAIPHFYVKVDNGGLAIRTSEDTTPINKGDLTRELDLARNNAQFYTERLIKYLCENSELYDEYTEEQEGGIYPERKTYSEAGYEIQS
jgi:hypothetical protein